MTKPEKCVHLSSIINPNEGHLRKQRFRFYNIVNNLKPFSRCFIAVICLFQSHQCSDAPIALDYDKSIIAVNFFFDTQNCLVRPKTTFQKGSG